MEFFTRMERISPLSTVGGVEVVSIHCILLSERSFSSFGLFFPLIFEGGIENARMAFGAYLARFGNGGYHISS